MDGNSCITAGSETQRLANWPPIANSRAFKSTVAPICYACPQKYGLDNVNADGLKGQVMIAALKFMPQLVENFFATKYILIKKQDHLFAYAWTT
jgi:hypothetical protein